MLLEDYPISEVAKDVQSSVDPDLAKWLSQYSNKTSVETMTKEEVEVAFKDEHPITRGYAIFRNDLTKKGTDKAKSGVLELVNLVENYNSTHKIHHPLTAYILEDALQLGVDKDPSFKERTTQYLENRAPRSCPHKKNLESVLSERNFLTGDAGLINHQLDEVAKIRSYGSRMEMMKKFLFYLPKNRHAEVGNKVWNVVKDFDQLRQNNLWVEQFAPKEESGDVAPGVKNITGFEKASHHVKRNQCNLATSSFLNELKQRKAPTFIPSARKTAVAIGNCIKRQGGRKRLAFWESIVKPLTDAYGIAGWSIANISVARYQWTLDENDKALATLAGVVKRTTDEKSEEYRSESLLLTAQILEDTEQIDLAIDTYEKFRVSFPTHGSINEALSALLLIYASKGEWNKVLEPAGRMVFTQSELSVDLRDVSVLGFALFWQGRAFLELKRTELALRTWERLSKEFYSTYYGAVGHYLLEQLDGKSLAVASGQATSFGRGEWYSEFSEEDRLRLRRIEGLLALGLKEKADCEVLELVTGDNPGRLAAKALLLHASNNWLEAIKIYSDLPRSFRNTLSAGMEMILFPKRFDDSIREYSKRLNMDPDFVFALIRQESVFNPKARSSAGAQGLMQLMGPTASLEAKKLTSPYVTEKTRQELLHKTLDNSALFDADVNLILGTHHLNRLLKSYESPVFTLSAYNAGAGAATRWQNKIQTNDLLLFIEKIPYKETRGYVKLILRNYFYYSRWYGEKDKALPHLESVTKSLLAAVEGGARPRKTVAIDVVN
jgi:tetratricopeptide (TPR) repeat protein